MFRPGKVLKVKIEVSADEVGFGRATVVEVDTSSIILQIRTSKGDTGKLPKGTRIWVVSDSADNPFNGLWSTTVTGTRLVHGKTALECTRPKFEPMTQRRKGKRVSVSCPVRIHGTDYDKLKAATRNLSRWGVGLEIYEDCCEQLPSGHYIDITIDSTAGPIDTKARIIQARMNWLANRTDVGLEFIDLETEAQENLDRLLLSLGGRPRIAPEGKDKTPAGVGGALSNWLKSTKDSVSFVKGAEDQLAACASEQDPKELEADDNDVTS